MPLSILIGWRLLRYRRWGAFFLILELALSIAICLSWFSVLETASVTPDQLRSWSLGQGKYRVTWKNAISPAVVKEAESALDGIDSLLDIDVAIQLEESISHTGKTASFDTLYGRFLDLSHPLAQGLYEIDRGNPIECTTIACLSVSTAAARDTGINPGEDVLLHFEGSSVQLPARVVSVMHSPLELHRSTFAIWGDNALKVALSSSSTGEARWITPSLDSETINTLTKNGFVVSTLDQVIQPGLALFKNPPTFWYVVIALVFIVLTVVVATVQAAHIRPALETLNSLGAGTATKRGAIAVYSLLIWLAGLLFSLIIGFVSLLVIIGAVRSFLGQDWGNPNISWLSFTLCAATSLGLIVLSNFWTFREKKKPVTYQIVKKNRDSMTIFLLAAGLSALVVALFWHQKASVYISLTGAMLTLIGVTQLITRRSKNKIATKLSALFSTRILPSLGSQANTQIVFIGLASFLASSFTGIALDTVALHRSFSTFDSVPDSTAVIKTEEPLTLEYVSRIERTTGTVSAHFYLLNWSVDDSASRGSGEVLNNPNAEIEENTDIPFSDPFSQVGAVESVADLQVILGHTPSDSETRAFLNGDGVRLLYPGVKIPKTTLLKMPEGLGDNQLLKPALEKDYGYYWNLPKLIVSTKKAKQLGLIPGGWDSIFLRSLDNSPLDRNQLYKALSPLLTEGTFSVETGMHKRLVEDFSKAASITYLLGWALSLLLISLVVKNISTTLRRSLTVLDTLGASHGEKFMITLNVLAKATFTPLLLGFAISWLFMPVFAREAGGITSHFYGAQIIPLVFAFLIIFAISWRQSKLKIRDVTVTSRARDRDFP